MPRRYAASGAPVLTGSLSESMRTLHPSASSALHLVQDQHSGVQRLVTGFELWENSLPLLPPTKQRLNAMTSTQSPHSIALLPEEWSLLKRVHMQGLLCTTIKRSASESDLKPLGPALDSDSDTTRSSLNGMASNLQAKMSPPVQNHDPTADSPTTADPGFPPSSSSECSPSALHPSTSQLSVSPSLTGPPYTPLVASPSHAPPPSLDLGSPCKALRTTQLPLAAALKEQASSIATRSVTTSSGPFSGSLAPWSVFPMCLRAREEAMDQQPPSPTASTSLSLLSAPPPAADPASPFDLFVTPARSRARTSIRAPGRHLAIITTASLPWLTGTSVNPLLRAAYLAADPTRRVMLLVPWLSPPDQEMVFPAGTRFTTPEAQEAYIRDWARNRTGLSCNFRISFYPGRYAAEKGSILPVGDITQMVPDHEADVAVLEEPEHLNWYHHGRRWTDKFNHVVGIMHTNYLDYARREEGGQMKELILKHINTWVCRIHCHKVIKLSDAVQKLPRQHTMFVHGVSPSFLRVGEQKAKLMQAAGGEESQAWSKGIYFIGKVLWAKGYTELLERMSEHTQRTGNNVHVDVYGSGPDLKAVEAEAARRQLNLTFNGARDHAEHSLQAYKVFVNPSLSDVVATTTAEALAMGKFVVCADHPSNRFFSNFPNCLIYRDSNEFSHCLSAALSRDPKPLSPDELHSLTWEAATERFLDVADISKKQPPLEMALDSLLHAAHNTLTGIESMRVLSGAGAHTRDLPVRVTDYLPSTTDMGGPFDNHARASKGTAAVGGVVARSGAALCISARGLARGR